MHVIHTSESQLKQPSEQQQKMHVLLICSLKFSCMTKISFLGRNWLHYAGKFQPENNVWQLSRQRYIMVRTAFFRQHAADWLTDWLTDRMQHRPFDKVTCFEQAKKHQEFYIRLISLPYSQQPTACPTPNQLNPFYALQICLFNIH